MKSRISKFLFIGMVVLIVILNYINFKRSKENPRVDHVKGLHIGIPTFETVDYLGRSITDSTYRGKDVYFQFINPASTDDIDLFMQVYDNFKSESINLVIFTATPSILQKSLKIKDKKVFIAGKNFHQIQQAFRIPANTGSFFLFDSDGNKLAEGNSGHGYENGPKLALNKLIWNETFDISEFIRLDDSLDQMEWFGQLGRIIESENKEVFLFFLSVRLCDQCGGGAIINRLRRLNATYGDAVGIYAVSFTQYSTFDIEALKSQAEISFPLINANTELYDTWDMLIQRFNRKCLDNIVFVTDKSGKVQGISFNECKCYESFFNLAESTIKKRLR